MSAGRARIDLVRVEFGRLWLGVGLQPLRVEPISREVDEPR